MVAYTWNREKQMFIALGKEFDMSAFKFTGSEDEIDLILCQAHICRPLYNLRF